MHGDSDSDLRHFELRPEDLVLLLLEGGLGLLQPRPQLLLLHLQAATVLLQLVDRPPSLAELGRKDRKRVGFGSRNFMYQLHLILQLNLNFLYRASPR